MPPAPINLSAEATAHLRRALDDATPEAGYPGDAALVWSPHTIAGQEIPAVILGWYGTAKRPADSFFDLCGHPVSILPTTLEHIAGKTIAVAHYPTGFPDGPPQFRFLKVT